MGMTPEQHLETVKELAELRTTLLGLAHGVDAVSKKMDIVGNMAQDIARLQVQQTENSASIKRAFERMEKTEESSIQKMRDVNSVKELTERWVNRGIGAMNYAENLRQGQSKSRLFTLADDTVYQYVLASSYSLQVQVGSASSGATDPNFIFRARPNAPPQAGALTTASANVTLTTSTVLTGTTGIDGNFTISVVNGSIYFENRTGGTKSIWVEVAGALS